MAMSFIGKPISLISHSDVRYRGILAGIDPSASTIQLSRVYSMGTEGRRPATEFIPPVAEPYEYIIFRASEVKDLAVDEAVDVNAARERSIHDDPAVVGAGQRQGPPPPQVQPQQPRGPTQSQSQRNARSNSVHTAMESVERAIGDLRQPTPPTNKIKVPTTDFDFQSSNAKFSKSPGNGSQSPSSQDSQEEPSYNPSKSFFDTLTPTNMAAGGGRGRGRRQAERERNVATFGEPGGVGLLGPGAYVGGWGGHGGRRGGGQTGRGRGVGRGI